jgi:hypothetical protein
MFLWPIKLFVFLLTHPKVGIPVAVVFFLFVIFDPLQLTKASP